MQPRHRHAYLLFNYLGINNKGYFNHTIHLFPTLFLLYSYCHYQGMFIVRRPSATLLTVAIRIVQRLPYVLLTAVEQ